MRILYAYGEEFTGERAREVHTINRVHSLAAAGAEVTLVAAESPLFRTPKDLLGRFGLESLERLKVVFLPRRLGFGKVGFVSTKIFYNKLGDWLKSHEKFDLVYVIHLKAASYLEGNHPELPVIFEAHEIFADSFPEGSAKFEKLRALEEEVYSRAAGVVATSNYLLSCLEERYPVPLKTTVIPNSVDTRFLEVPLAGFGSRELIYVGSFQPWKGVDVAVQAMAELPEFSLQIFGGSAEQVRVLQAKATSNVHFQGYVGQPEILQALGKASVALIPNRLTPKSSLYTFPMKLLEYAAAGRLVVSSDLPVVRELGLGEWAEVVPAGDAHALAEGIRRTEKRNRPELREEAREWARKHTWDKSAELLKVFLASLHD